MAWGKESRHARGYGSQWSKTRKRILIRDNGLCIPCTNAGRLTIAREVDHITPKANGGTDDADNLQCICIPCHQSKTEREAAEAQGRTYHPKITIGTDGWPIG